MKHEAVEGEEGPVDGVPVSAVLGTRRRNLYGSVPGLDDEELADPYELERQVYAEELGPVLMLPVDKQQRGLRPDQDESGSVNWGAFGTVDFERSVSRPDSVNSKIAWLREQLKDLLIRLSIVKERLPGKARYVVLKYLRMGVIKLEHIVSEDMLALARLDWRARGIQCEIARMAGVRKARQERALATLLA